MSREKLHQIKQFLEANSQIRDKGQPFDRGFRSWVRNNGFVLCNGAVQKQVTDTAGTVTYLPVVTIPDVGRSIYALHATVGNHVGHDKTKKLVRVLCFCFWGSSESSTA